MKEERTLLIILTGTYLLAFIVFLIYSLIINPNYDIAISDQNAFIIRGSGILNGKIPYRDFNNNAAPLSGYLWLPFVFLSNITKIDFGYLIRILFSSAIILSSLILYKLEKKRNNPHAFFVSLIYGCNPFFFYLIFIWGTDETLCPLLVLGPIYFFEKGKKEVGTLLIVIGAGIKYFPILLVPAIWLYSKNWKSRVLLSILFLTLLSLITIPFYVLAPEAFLSQFDDPVGNIADQGLPTIIYWFFNLEMNKINIILKLVCIIVITITGLIIILKKNWDYSVFVLPFLAFFIFYTKFQLSYIVIIFPFLFKDFHKLSKNSVIGALIYLLSMYYGEAANALIHIRELPIWLLIFNWFIVALFYISLISYYLFNISSVQPSINSEANKE